MSALRRALGGFIGALSVALVLPAGAIGAGGGPYVALGDSYSAAPLVPNPVGTPLGCLRSDHNYPSLLARELGLVAVRDVSCTGATTRDMTAAQTVRLGSNPPQFDGLGSDARLVTIGIGGDDEGLVEVAETCLRLGLLAPRGTACRSRFAPGGVDAILARIAATGPKVAAVLRGIRERAPHARILVVGYPDVLPRSGNGCYPIVPLSPDDVRYFDSLIVQTNAMLAEQAAANGAEYVDTYADSIGHDVCTLPGTRWFEGVVPGAVALPLHPNALGMQSMARSVLRVVRLPRPGPVLSRLARIGPSAVPRGRALRLRYDLDRPATVAVALLRAVPGQRIAEACRRPRRPSSDSRACRRYVAVGGTSVLGQFGENSLSVGSATYGRRPGLYRLTVTPTSDDRDGASHVVWYRVTH